MATRTFSVIIHGGAGVVAKTTDPKPYKNALTRITRDLYKFAQRPEVTAVDVVEHGVKLLEDCPLFNAGAGAVFASDGTHEMEAGIMDGELHCGSVSLMKTVKNPISAARVVLEHGNHVYMAGPDAEKLVVSIGKLETMPSEYFDTEKRIRQLAKAKERNKAFRDHDLDNDDAPTGTGDDAPDADADSSDAAPAPPAGACVAPPQPANEVLDLPPLVAAAQVDDEGARGTVGCVCMLDGRVAAATSTGGMTNKLNGRVGDTPIIGAGTYANNATCAVSATGSGEEFIRHVVAYDISARMEYCGLSLKDAVWKTVHERLTPEAGGVIAVDPAGAIVMDYNSNGMFRGTCTHEGAGAIGIWEDMLSIKL